ncbi:hypothetical protein [Acinetobacter nematophilus]|uniref:DUF600 family protein n=1 Tax=Acinetobacter nematophilus TaxID=2994642 RepID=A0A9X3IIH8_9GAMM|nr:hypothetical protein [Acinetobacter nematophilus]
MHNQVELLNKIVQEVHKYRPFDYDSWRFEYKFNPDEGWSEYGVFFFRNHTEYLPPDFNYDLIIKFSQELHDEMQSHTGGDWRKFILNLDEQGKAKTQFIYEIQSCMDEFND